MAVEPLSDITLYVLAIALVFYSLVTTPIAGATVARLFAGVALFTVGMVALVVGLTGTVGRVFVLECAMPAAVTPLLLTIEFGVTRREALRICRASHGRETRTPTPSRLRTT